MFSLILTRRRSFKSLWMSFTSIMSYRGPFPSASDCSCIAFAALGSFWAAVPLLVVAGFAMNNTSIATLNLMQNAVQGRLRGRVMSLYSTTQQGAPALGSLLIGAVAVNEFVVRPQAEAAQAARALELENAVKALEEGRYEEAQAAFQAIVGSGSRLAPLAAHYLARTQLEGGGDAEAAAATLASIGGTEGGAYERLALLKAAYFRADTLTMPELEATLGSLVTEDTALGAMARELIAAKAYAIGDIARARTEYSRLKFDAAAPQGVVQRAEIALDAIPVLPDGAGEVPLPTEAPTDAAADAPQETGQ